MKKLLPFTHKLQDAIRIDSVAPSSDVKMGDVHFTGKF